MNKKTRRLSSGFWHKFIPNTTKLISPQNIKFEIWDLQTHKIIEKWNPDLPCANICEFSKSGKRFVISAHPKFYRSDFKIYDTSTFKPINQFSFPETSCHPIFISNEDRIVFGTHKGNVYEVDISKKSISDKNDIHKLFQTKESMVMHVEKDSTGQFLFFAVRPFDTAPPELRQIHLLSDYILCYNIQTQERTEIRLPVSGKIYHITCSKFHNKKLAIMRCTYAGMLNDRIVHDAELYIYDLVSGQMQLVRENFKLRETFEGDQTVSWSTDSKLAFISLNEVVMLDTKNKGEEVTIPFHKPSSVEFSAEGKFLAIGGDKAILYKVD
jgi:hypothetical protein